MTRNKLVDIKKECIGPSHFIEAGIREEEKEKEKGKRGGKINKCYDVIAD